MPATDPHTFLFTAAKVVDILLDIYIWIIIARAVTSWITINPYDGLIVFPRRNFKQRARRILVFLYVKLTIFLYRVTEPVFRPVRRLIPRHSLPIDLAPLVVLVAIMILRYLLFQAVFLIMRGL